MAVSLGSVTVLRTTDAAVLVTGGDLTQDEVWVPRSVITDDGDLDSDAEKDDEGEMFVKDWFADKESLP